MAPRMRALVLCVPLIVGIAGPATSTIAAGAEQSVIGCDTLPTGVDTSNHWLHFEVPPGLMPDSRFDLRPAKLQVHRVRPVYAHGRCSSVPRQAAVLVHGRTLTGPVVFDLRHIAPDLSTLSVQEGLARAGIDTFAPSLLGYGRSTRFDDGLNDPGNASLRPYLSDGSCPHAEGCDRTHNPIFPLDRQGSRLFTNPLGEQRQSHSSATRFARVDVWVRDIRQVVDDAIDRAQPTDGKVTLLGYSLGAQSVGRALYPANPVLPGSAAFAAKVNRAVFLSPLFGGPTEETTPLGGFVTFPLEVANRAETVPGPMPEDREAICTGHTVTGSGEQLWSQVMEQDVVGRNWGGDDPEQPAGLNRSPTFSSYGWNAAVAGQLTPPTLVMQGLDDRGVPGGAATAPAVYNALPASMTNKILVMVDCASHALPIEGCSDERCEPVSGTPYGGTPGTPWSGPHATLKAALIEWIKDGTFNGAPSGRFIVDKSGVVTSSEP